MTTGIEQAQAAIRADQEQRIAEALRAVQTILEEQRCQIIAVPQIVDGRIVAAVQIVAVQE